MLTLLLEFFVLNAGGFLAFLMLAFRGGSMDIDGSMLYYDSGAGAWHKFHNDNGDEQATYAALTVELAECAPVAK